MKKKHICVYTSKKVLEHKKKDGAVYWKFANCPKIMDEWWKKLDYDMRLYFAVNGFIVGYFEIDGWDLFDTVDFHSQTWKKIFPIPQKQFQGFKYI